MSESPAILAAKRPTAALSLIAIAALACFVLTPPRSPSRPPRPSQPPPPRRARPKSPSPASISPPWTSPPTPAPTCTATPAATSTPTTPSPPTSPTFDPFYVLYNVNSQELNAILTKAAVPSPARTPDEQKIGDYFSACANTSAIDAAGLKPIQPLLDEIAALHHPRRPARHPPRQAPAHRRRRLLRLRRAAGLQGRHQADRLHPAGRPRPAGEGLLPAHRRQGRPNPRPVRRPRRQDAHSRRHFARPGPD